MRPTTVSAACFILSATLGINVLAETDTERVTRFSGYFGTNKHARLVWQAESNGNSMSSCYGSSPNRLMKLDTRTGTIETLVAQSSSSRWTDPVFTWDGQRVVYYDMISYRVHVINWDGSGDRTLSGTYSGAGRCWRSADGKDYALLTSTKPTGSGRKLVRRNIDTPSDSLDILATTWAPATGADFCNQGTHWVSMSGDGMYIAGNFPEWPDVGTFRIGASSVTLFEGGNAGCWPTISRELPYRIMHWDGDHNEIHKDDVNGSQLGGRKTIPAVITNGGEPEALRWANDSNYVSMIAPPYGGGYGNPWILRLSGTSPTPIAVQLSTQYAEGNCDVFVYTGQMSGVTGDVAPARGLAAQETPARRDFDVRGRSLARGTPLARGVFVRVAPGTGRPLASLGREDGR